MLFMEQHLLTPPALQGKASPPVAEPRNPEVRGWDGGVQDGLLRVEKAFPESPKTPGPRPCQGECPCNQPLAGSRAGKPAGSSRECNAEANAGRARPNCMQISQTEIKTTPFPLCILQFVLPPWIRAPECSALAATPKTPHVMPKMSCWLQTCQRGSELSQELKPRSPGLGQRLQSLDDQTDAGDCTEPISHRQGSSVHSP